MTAEDADLDRLAKKLWQQGVAAFCPTTLSTTREKLLATVTRLGAWIARGGHEAGALPLGIHLEGPFISPEACGAHPSEILRPADLVELEELWLASQKTLKILTLAPETLSKEALRKLVAWSRKRAIVLSLGHSRATETEARAAFRAGFRNVTHSWNAMTFHHRQPGLLAAAVGNPEVFLELIIDGVHVDPTVARWTRALHPARRLCFVSDCAPAAGLKAGTRSSFGPLTVEVAGGAARLLDGRLAGGGYPIAEMYRRWLASESRTTGSNLGGLLKSSLPHLTVAPLESLGIAASRLGKRKLRWTVQGSRLTVRNSD